jgi:hypothetical protein
LVVVEVKKGAEQPGPWRQLLRFAARLCHLQTEAARGLCSEVYLKSPAHFEEHVCAYPQFQQLSYGPQGEVMPVAAPRRSWSDEAQFPSKAAMGFAWSLRFVA